MYSLFVEVVVSPEVAVGRPDQSAQHTAKHHGPPSTRALVYHSGHGAVDRRIVAVLDLEIVQLLLENEICELSRHHVQKHGSGSVVAEVSRRAPDIVEVRVDHQAPAASHSRVWLVHEAVSDPRAESRDVSWTD